jgi:hypothetical protein
MATGIKVGDMLMGLALDPNLGSFNAGAAVAQKLASQIARMAVESESAKHDVIALGQSLGILTPETAARLKQEQEALRLAKERAAAEKALAEQEKARTEKQAQVQKALNTIGFDSAKIAKIQAGMKSDWQKISESSTRTADSFWRMAAAAAAFFSAAKTVQVIQGVLDVGGALDDTAQKTGFSAEALQRWGYSAKLGGTDASVLNGALLKLSKSLKDVGTGKGPTADALEQLGISLKDPAIKAKDLDKILYLVSDRLSTMPDGASKAAAMMSLFGKSGADLIPVLNGGVLALKQQHDELSSLNGVISNESVGAMAKLGDNVDKAKVAWEGFKTKAVEAILPRLTVLVDKFLAWTASNDELIKSKAIAFFDGFTTALEKAGAAIAFVAAHWEIFAAAFIAGTVISAIAKGIMLITTLMTAMTAPATAAWMAVLGPIALIILGIGVVVAVIYKFRTQIGSALRAVGRFFGGLWDGIKNGAANAWDIIKRSAESLWDALVNGFKVVGNWFLSLPLINRIEKLVRRMGELKAMFSDDPDAYAKLEFDEVRYAPAPTVAATGAPPTLDRNGRSFAPTPVQQMFSNSVVINAPQANAREVSQLVDGKLRDSEERMRRELGSALGVTE